MNFGQASRTGDMVLEAKGLTKGYDDGPLFKDLSIRIERGDRIGLVGPNGCGKSTLLKTILNVEEPDAGSVRFGTNVEVGYYDQQLSSVSPEVDAVEAVRPPKNFDFSPGMARNLLAKFGVKGDLGLQKISAMSGGEKSRVALARLAALNINVMVLDEPTNHLDLWARDSLERALKAFGGTLMIVSHDRYFLDQIANRVLVWEQGEWIEHEGNYTAYVAFRDAINAQPDSEQSAKKAKKEKKQPEPSKSEQKPKRRFPYRPVEDIESDVTRQEELIASLEADMVRPDVLKNPKELQSVQHEYHDARSKLSDLMAAWEEALELNA
ncbi:ATP-binding cassette domain-containing protein [Stratiformator vulcanicus]